eukprot:549913-Hanusia_phi.AAC.1
MPSEHPDGIIIMGNSTLVTCSFKFCEGHDLVTISSSWHVVGNFPGGKKSPPPPVAPGPARSATAEVTHGSRGRQTPGHCPARPKFRRQGCRQEWCNA